MKASEMLVVAATAILLVVGLRFAPNRGAVNAVTGTFVVCAFIYAAYRVLRSQ